MLVYVCTHQQGNTMEPTNNLDVTEVAATIVEALKETGATGPSMGVAELSCTFSIQCGPNRYRVVVTEIMH